MATAQQLLQSRVASVYIPRTCLQGEDLPAHVTWTTVDVAKVRIKVPDELQVKEIYNVPLTSITNLSARTVELADFKVNGFVGLVFGTRHVQSGKRNAQVSVTLLDKHGRVLQDVIREVLLFRPLLKAERIPLRPLGIEVDTHGVSRLAPPLGLENVGDGTAVVFVQLVNSPTAQITHPARIDEFVKRYRDDLIKGVKEVQKDFPQFSSLLAAYLSIIERATPPTSTVKRSLRRLDKKFSVAFAQNEDFLEALGGAVSRAFFRNLEVVTELHSFLDYLNSIGAGRVILMNALDVLHFESGSNVIRLRLHVTDFQWGDYPFIDLDPVILDVSEAGEIPVYALFAWLTPGGGGG